MPTLAVSFGAVLGEEELSSGHLATGNGKMELSSGRCLVLDSQARGRGQLSFGGALWCPLSIPPVSVMGMVYNKRLA